MVYYNLFVCGGGGVLILRLEQNINEIKHLLLVVNTVGSTEHVRYINYCKLYKNTVVLSKRKAC